MLETPRMVWKRSKVMFVFILPATLLALRFFAVPFVSNFIISLSRWNIITNSGRYVRLENYVSIFGDPIFTNALVVTTVYTIVVVPLLLLFGLIFALLVNDASLRGNGFFQTVYFIPWVIPWLTAGLIWRFLYNDLFGPINYVLQTLGIVEEPIRFLNAKWSAIGSVIVVAVWKTVGYNMVILLVGLKSIPQQIYEAAAIDGVGPMREFLHITLPLIKSSIALMVIMAVVGSYLAFDHFWIVTRGAPAHETETVLTWLYQTSFFRFRFGEGAAMSVMLLLITAVFAVVQVRVFKLLRLK